MLLFKGLHMLTIWQWFQYETNDSVSIEINCGCHGST